MKEEMRCNGIAYGEMYDTLILRLQYGVLGDRIGLDLIP